MKIAFVYDVVYPYVLGGAQKRFWELSRRLAARGHEVHLFGMKSWEGPADFKKEGVFIHGIARHRPLYTSSGIRSSWQVICFSLAVLPALLRRRFDIIDCNTFPYLPFLPVKLVSSLKRTPLVTTWQEVWGNYWYSYAGILLGSLGRIAETMVIRLSANMIVHSHKVKEELIRCSLNIKKIKVIPDGLDVRFIESLPISDEKSDLIFVGRLIKEKNIELAMRSVSLIKEEFPEIKFLIIGDGPEKLRLMRMTEESGLKENITFAGFLEYEKVISHLKASKILLFPSSREGFGIVLLEAMGCGLPVVTVRGTLNASTELIDEGRNGFIALPDPSDISAKAVTILSDRFLRERMSDAAKIFSAQYDWDRIAGENEKLYAAIYNKNISGA